MAYIFLSGQEVVQTLHATISNKPQEDLRAELAASSGLNVLVSDDPAAVCGAIWDGRVFTIPEPPAPTLDLDIQADKTVVAVGEVINIAARLLAHGTDVVAPVDQGFAVPVDDAEGAVAMVKGVAFVQGVASVSLTFGKSGYYRITDAGINRKLPTGQQIALASPFEVTVYE